MVNSKHTALLDQSKMLAVQAAAPLAAVLSQLKLYTAQSIIAEDKKLVVARDNLESFTKSVVAPDITEMAALVTASTGWPARVDPPLEVGSTKHAAAREAFEAALADAATGLTPRKAVCEADIPISELALGAKPVELGTAELCGVRFRFRLGRGCSCAKANIVRVAKNGNGIEGVDRQNLCLCGIVCEVTAEPSCKMLAALYEACGSRARAVDDLVFTEDHFCDDVAGDDFVMKDQDQIGSGRSDNDSKTCRPPVESHSTFKMDLMKTAKHVATPFATVANTFGRVTAEVTVISALDTSSNKSCKTTASCEVWLYEESKENNRSDVMIAASVGKEKSRIAVVSLVLSDNVS